MACKKAKQIVLTIHDQKHLRKKWFFDFDGQQFLGFLTDLASEMKRLGVIISIVRNRDAVISINSYADLLNVVKISSPEDGHSNQCIGHIIGKSPNLDIMEDISTALRRVAFAPETIAPSGEFRKVCHNCGCGC
ncbi:MAG: hypothetical protein A2X80_00615 [Geobacteraceae bacterium GWB2_52_12]|nr:MAG: hypothetical protein A2X80_00615 [Geobacteraceae bacterium GWB2_52_12]